MKKKILIGSIFAALLMLSMPVISNIQAQPAPVSEDKEIDECSICPFDGDWCEYVRSEVSEYESAAETARQDNHKLWALYLDYCAFFFKIMNFYCFIQ